MGNVERFGNHGYTHFVSPLSGPRVTSPSPAELGCLPFFSFKAFRCSYSWACCKGMEAERRWHLSCWHLAQRSRFVSSRVFLCLALICSLFVVGEMMASASHFMTKRNEHKRFSLTQSLMWAGKSSVLFISLPLIHLMFFFHLTVVLPPTIPSPHFGYQFLVISAAETSWKFFSIMVQILEEKWREFFLWLDSPCV